jgi:3-oxoacyl-[acyl-carrier protein] reductase
VSVTRETILVLGASSVIGAALVRRLARRDALLLLHYSTGRERITALEQSVAGSPSKTVPLQADLGDLAAVDALVTEVKNRCEHLQAIVYLPGLPLRLDRFHLSSVARLEEDLHLSLLAPARLLQTFLPGFRQADRKGKVVLMLSSVTQGIPPKGMAAYTAVKYAQLGLMRALAAEYADKNVCVNGVSPGAVETPFLANLPEKFLELSAEQNPHKRNVLPDDIGPVVDFLLSPKSDFITGANLPVTGGAGF